MDRDFVQQSRLEALLHDGRSHQRHFLARGCGTRLLDGAFYAVRDEGVLRIAPRHLVRRLVGHDEERNAGLRSLTAPRIRDLVGPATCHDGADAIGELVEQPCANRGHLELRIPPTWRFAVGKPSEESIAANAKWESASVVR